MTIFLKKNPGAWDLKENQSLFDSQKGVRSFDAFLPDPLKKAMESQDAITPKRNF